MSKKKFAINESLELLFEEIITVLPSVKTDWEYIEATDDIKEHYSTEINGVEVLVYERGVKFSLRRGSLADETRTYQTFYRKHPTKIKIFNIISQRFADDDDYVFYKRVLRFMNGQVTLQKSRNEINFTEEKSS